MKSTSGQYFIALDHVRAVAAFTVFAWHFNHIHGGERAGPPVFPLSFLTEGHTGVAIFMTLSGYLFARLLDGKEVRFPAFIYNRAVRLLPMLITVLLLVGIERIVRGQELLPYLQSVAAGAVMPTFPNGGWSLTVEAHFYVLLPLLLYILRKNALSLVAVVIVCILARSYWYSERGEIQTLSYWTIIGRIDQFILGILAYHYRRHIAGRHFLAGISALIFLSYFYLFDLGGGFFVSPSYPSPSAIWIIMPTAEGLFYAIMIAWYDNSFSHRSGHISRFIARIGTYSYSIYLLHFFVVFRMAQGIDRHIADLSNVYIALVASVFGFLAMVPVAHVSYTYIEKPFLKFRRPYIAEHGGQRSH